ncbi:YidC/Oxa1 family membrane protein insertase [Desulfofalx alkaliphila]|uniref:YidC/Oxa1 family membrane protein insertase n=1 Tax=Desulfofalx alkaliphila TaxID=105483 RepID=UPI000B26B5E7|nr:YidC/Oxa1 family membrane protein insertase [Desulfofalx alkaliphila]
MWNALVEGMRSVINSLYLFTDTIGIPSYALAIVLLTVIIKVALYPLTKKQMVSMKMMQKIAPEIKAIQDKYKKKDPQKMQKKIMELYQKHNVNPMAGCFPILIQMPILIALYRALFNFDFINPEHATIFIINLAERDPTFILPILAAVTTFMQSKLTTNTADTTQRTMLYVMPALIGWIAATVPSGLALYWVIFNLVGAIQQFYINKHVLATEKKEVAEN